MCDGQIARAARLRKYCLPSIPHILYLPFVYPGEGVTAPRREGR